jgi:hypothetical protein
VHGMGAGVLRTVRSGGLVGVRRFPRCPAGVPTGANEFAAGKTRCRPGADGFGAGDGRRCAPDGLVGFRSVPAGAPPVSAPGRMNSRLGQRDVGLRRRVWCGRRTPVCAGRFSTSIRRSQSHVPTASGVGNRACHSASCLCPRDEPVRAGGHCVFPAANSFAGRGAGWGAADDSEFNSNPADAGELVPGCIGSHQSSMKVRSSVAFRRPVRWCSSCRWM